MKDEPSTRMTRSPAATGREEDIGARGSRRMWGTDRVSPRRWLPRLDSGLPAATMLRLPEDPREPDTQRADQADRDGAQQHCRCVRDRRLRGAAGGLRLRIHEPAANARDRRHKPELVSDRAYITSNRKAHSLEAGALNPFEIYLFFGIPAIALA